MSVRDRHVGVPRSVDDALPHVYGYLVRRCANAATAEDLTAETFMAAVAALHDTETNCNLLDLNIAWLIDTARHKLIDHWRRTERRKEELAGLWDDMAIDDPHTVLTLRYLDDLPVGDVATTIGRIVHGTEALLAPTKAAYRNHAVHVLHAGARDDMTDPFDALHHRYPNRPATRTH